MSLSRIVSLGVVLLSIVGCCDRCQPKSPAPDPLTLSEQCAAPAHFYTFETPATNDPPVWIRWRLPAAGDLAMAEGVEFDLFCDNLTRFFEFVFRAYTDDKKRGGYHFRLQAKVENGWGRVVLKKSDVNTCLSGTTLGWSDIRFFELIGVKGVGRGAAKVCVSDVRPHFPAKTEAVVVACDSCILTEYPKSATRWVRGRISRMVRALDRQDVGTVTMSDLDVAKRGFPETAKLAVFPINGQVPEGILPQLEAFVARGGKILYCRKVPTEIARLMSAKKCGLRAEFVFDRDVSMDDDLVPMLEQLVPAFATNVAAAKARRAADDAAARAAVAQFPPKPGESRGISSHHPYGPFPGRTWDDAAAIAAKNGFTTFAANLCTGEIAYYDSKVLTVADEVAARGDALEQFKAACRRHGLKTTGWRCCFTMRATVTPKALRDARVAEGRTAVNDKGEVSDKWLCPNHPANRRTEVAAMAELATKGLDCVSLDFIRYSDASWCFCPTCRRLFEQKLGHPVKDWPRDVMERWDIKTGPYAREWQAFREETITSLVREISAAVRQANPNVRLRSSGYMDPETSRIGEGQNWALWCRENLIDGLGMMDYVDSFAGFKALIRAQKKFDVGTTCAVVPTFGPSLWPDEGDAKQALNAARHIQAIRDAGYSGFSYFTYDDRAERILPILATGPLRK